MLSTKQQYKVRVLTKEKHRITFGITLPVIFSHWINTLVTIRESGNSLILESGAKPVPFKLKDVQGQTIEVINI